MMNGLHIQAVKEDRERELKVHMEHNRIYYNNRDLLDHQQGDSEKGLKHLISWLSTIWRRILSADWLHGQAGIEVLD